MTLSEKVVALHRALSSRSVPHAFGGALALAYWTLDPRGTSDIDVNVFLPVDDAPRVLDALPSAVSRPAGTAETVARDGQVRLWWDETPVDVFFDYAPVHADAARNQRIVDFDGEQIPILGPDELAVFKVMFDRTRDWADVEVLLEEDRLDPRAVVQALRTMLDDGDQRLARFDEAVRKAGDT
jgi:hypothetical protein